MIREATLNDAKIITKINNECYPFLDRYPVTYFEWLMKYKLGTILVYEIQHRVIGFIHYEVIEDRAIIHRIGVLARYRGRGIGSALLNEALRRLKGKVREAIAYVSVYNHNAYRWFVTRGFSKHTILRPEVYTWWEVFGALFNKNDYVVINSIEKLNRILTRGKVNEKLFWWYPKPSKEFFRALLEAPGVILASNDGNVIVHVFPRRWYISIEYVAFNDSLTIDSLKEYLVKIAEYSAKVYKVPYCESPLELTSLLENTYYGTWVEVPLVKVLSS